MEHSVKLPSGRDGWRGHLQEVYETEEEFHEYDRIYNIAERIGYNDPFVAWEENPIIQGSVHPGDLARYEPPKPEPPPRIKFGLYSNYPTPEEEIVAIRATEEMVGYLHGFRKNIKDFKNALREWQIRYSEQGGNDTASREIIGESIRQIVSDELGYM